MKKYLRRIGIGLLLFGTLISFQNCTKGFISTSAGTDPMTSSSTDSSQPPSSGTPPASPPDTPAPPTSMPTPDPTPSLTVSEPLVIDGKTDLVISGVKITNPDGPCIRIKNSKNITIQDSEIGPCKTSGIQTESQSINIVIQRNYIHDTISNNVSLDKGSNIHIFNNRLERGSSGVYALGSTQVVVEKNKVLNVQGPMARGQFVQFNGVNGGGNKVICNEGESILGEGKPEDAINMFNSNGIATDPILIRGNKIKGGGPSRSGGGIMTGDGTGSYMIVQDNILVDPGQYGVAVAGGHDIKLLNNKIYAKQAPWTNVGLYIWDQYNSNCNNITVEGNEVNWTHRDGFQNPMWNGQNCGTQPNWSLKNTPYAKFGPEILDETIEFCK